jgi:hypothetical protein
MYPTAPAVLDHGVLGLCHRKLAGSHARSGFSAMNHVLLEWSRPRLSTRVFTLNKVVAIEALYAYDPHVTVMSQATSVHMAPHTNKVRSASVPTS